jgi:hypothetical protein
VALSWMRDDGSDVVAVDHESEGVPDGHARSARSCGSHIASRKMLRRHADDKGIAAL